MNDLAAAQVIGGVVVTIGADLSNLRAGESEAKIVARRIEQNVKITIPVVIGLLPATAAAQLTSQIARLQASLPPIRVPVMLDFSGVQQQQIQLAQMTRVSSGAPVMGGGSAPQLLGGGIQGMLPAPGQGTAGSPGARFVPSNTIGSPSPGGGSSLTGDVVSAGGALMLAGGGGAGIGAGGGWIRGARGWAAGAGANPMTAVRKAFFPLMAAEGAVAVGGAVNSIGDMTADWWKGEGDASKQQTRIDAGRESIRSIPLGGGIIDKLGYGTFAAGNAIWNLAHGRGLKTSYTIAEETSAETAKIDAKSEKMQRRIDVGASWNEQARSISAAASATDATIGMTPEQVAVFGATQDLASFNKEADRARIAGARKDSLDTINARSALQGRLGRARGDESFAQNQADAMLSTDVASMRGGTTVAGLRAGGQTIDANRAEILNQKADARARFNIEAADMQHRNVDYATYIRANVRANAADDASDAQLAAYNKIVGREGDEIVAGSKSQISQSRMRIAHQYDQADEEAIHESYRPRIDDAQRVWGQNSDQVNKLKEEEAAKIDESRAKSAVNNSKLIVDAESGERAARLRAAHEYGKAELELFDDNAKKRLAVLKEAGAKEEAITAESNRLKAERDELTEDQKRRIRESGYSLAGRREAAQYEIQDMPGSASAIRQINAMAQEMRDAKPGEKVDTANTMIAELRAIEHQIIAPRVYATTGDRLRDVPGGPGGSSGRDRAEMLKLIRDAVTALIAIRDKPGGLAQ